MPSTAEFLLLQHKLHLQPADTFFHTELRSLAVFHLKWTSTRLTFLKLEDAFFRGDRKYIQEKAAVPKEQKTEMGQEIVLGEDAIGLVNTAESDGDREYTRSEKPLGQTAQLAKAK